MYADFKEHNFYDVTNPSQNLVFFGSDLIIWNLRFMYGTCVKFCSLVDSANLSRLQIQYEQRVYDVTTLNLTVYDS